MPINITSFTSHRDSIYRQIVSKKRVMDTDTFDISDAIEKSTKVLGEYVTLSEDLLGKLKSLMEKIEEYCSDRSLLRPLNFMLNASPGSGKSWLVKHLSKTLDMKLEVINMAGWSEIDDFHQPIKKLKDYIDAADDNFGILFIDEFDSNIDNLKLLLPLMWDGEFRYAESRVNIENVIIILAGSSPNIEKVNRLARTMDDSLFQIDGNQELYGSKLIDLLSRINGGIYNIPKFDNGKNSSVDQVCVAVSILKRRFDDLTHIPWSLLKFISKTHFRYSTRSIGTLLNLISNESYNDNKIELADFELPLGDHNRLYNSVLSYHLLIGEAPYEIVNRWNKYKDINNLVLV